MLLPYRVHRAGSTGEAVAAAQEAMGTPGNPVTGVVVDSGDLVVTLADGSITRQALPAGMGGGEDQIARGAAAAAEAVADGATTSAANAQAAANSASAAAAAAQGTADNAVTAATAAADTANANTGRLDAFPAGTGGVDQTARDAADGAQAGARRHRVPSLPMSAPRTTRTARPERRRRRHRLAPMMPSRWPMEKLTLRARRRRRGKSQRIGQRTKIPIRSRRRNW